MNPRTILFAAACACASAGFLSNAEAGRFGFVSVPYGDCPEAAGVGRWKPSKPGEQVGLGLEEPRSPGA